MEKNNETIIDENKQEVVDSNPREVKEEKPADVFVIKLPEEEKKDPLTVEPNKPAHWSMRAASGLIDLCLIFASVFGLRALFVATPMGNYLRELSREIVQIQDDYKLEPLVKGSEETVGYKVYEGEEKYTTSNYQVYEDEEGKYIVMNNDKISDELLDAYTSAVSGDTEYKNATFNYRLVDFGFVALSGFIAEGIFIFAIPLLNKRRATLGKLAAGEQVINSKYQTKTKWYQMFGRWLWTYGVEGILPYLFISSLTTVIVPIVLFVITLCNKERKTLHDFVCRTRVIEKRTFLPLDEQ